MRQEPAEPGASLPGLRPSWEAWHNPAGILGGGHDDGRLGLGFPCLGSDTRACGPQASPPSGPTPVRFSGGWGVPSSGDPAPCSYGCHPMMSCLCRLQPARGSRDSAPCTVTSTSSSKRRPLLMAPLPGTIRGFPRPQGAGVRGLRQMSGFRGQQVGHAGLRGSRGPWLLALGLEEQGHAPRVDTAPCGEAGEQCWPSGARLRRRGGSKRGESLPPSWVVGGSVSCQAPDALQRDGAVHSGLGRNGGG